MEFVLQMEEEKNNNKQNIKLHLGKWMSMNIEHGTDLFAVANVQNLIGREK